MDKDYIEELQQELSIYYRAFKELTKEIERCHFKNNRLKNGFSSLLNKFICAKNHEQCIKIKNIISKKYIKEEIKTYHKSSAYEIIDKISEHDSYEDEKKKKYTYDKLKDAIAKEDEYIKQIYEVMNLYTSCLWRIKCAKKALEEEKKKPKEIEKKTTPSPTPQTKSTYRYSDPEDEYGTVRRTTHEERIFTEEECKAKVDTLLTEEISYTDKKTLYKSLAKNTPGFYSTDLTNNYANSGTIDKCIEIENNINSLSNMKDKQILDSITEIAINCYKVGKRYLMDDYVFNVESNSLMSKVKADRFIEQYTKAYNLYQKRYQKLSNEEKNKLMQEFVKKYLGYKTLFGISSYHIITPEELRTKLNKSIIEECTKKAYEYVNKDHITPFRIRRRTTLMDELEIVRFYKSISHKKANDDNIDYKVHKDLYGEQEATEYYKKARENMALFQKNIINEIIYKTSKYRVQNANLSEEEKAKQYEILQYKICKEYLGEEPLFEIRQKPINKESHIKETIDSKKEAEKRFFGLSKLQRTISQINGTWSKYQRIIATEELTDSQIRDLNNMFKK